MQFSRRVALVAALAFLAGTLPASAQITGHVVDVNGRDFYFAVVNVFGLDAFGNSVPRAWAVTNPDGTFSTTPVNGGPLGDNTYLVEVGAWAHQVTRVRNVVTLNGSASVGEVVVVPDLEGIGVSATARRESHGLRVTWVITRYGQPLNGSLVGETLITTPAITKSWTQTSVRQALDRRWGAKNTFLFPNALPVGNYACGTVRVSLPNAPLMVVSDSHGWCIRTGSNDLWAW